MSDLRDMCPKCGAQEKVWMQRSPDGLSKCVCGFEGKHTEWLSPTRVLAKVEKLINPTPNPHRGRDEAAVQWCADNQFATEKDRGVAFKDGWDAALANDPAVLGVLKAANDMREFIDGTLAVLECESRMRYLSDDDWAHAMFFRDKYDEALAAYRERTTPEGSEK